jgi:hypothetical protein
MAKFFMQTFFVFHVLINLNFKITRSSLFSVAIGDQLVAKSSPVAVRGFKINTLDKIKLKGSPKV